MIRTSNALAIVEAGYRLEGTEVEWLGNVLEAAARDLEQGHGSYAFTCRIEPRALTMSNYVERSLDPRFGVLVTELNRTVPNAFFDLLSRRAVVCGGLVQSAPVALRAHFQAASSNTGIADGFSMFAQDGEGYAINVSFPSSKLVRTAPRVRGLLTRVGVHLASAMRLRRRLRESRVACDGLFAPTGEVAHAEGPLRSDRALRDLMKRAVIGLERARSDKNRRDPERALQLWRGLVAGEWSLVDHWESDGRRYLAAYRNRPDVQDPRYLTRQQRLVLSYASLGGSNKEIAFTLGLSEKAVSAAIAQLLKKLRCTRRNQLLAFADPGSAAHVRVNLDGDELGVLAVAHAPDSRVLARLSPAERDVTLHLVAGKTNADIAGARGTSLRTVANQVRGLFAKFGVNNRTALVRVITRSK